MKKTKIYALSTIDNPYNPFDNFDSWLRYDLEKGYNSCAYLARIAKISDSFTEDENNQEIKRAINEILKYNPTGLYMMVESEEEILQTA